MFYATLPTAPLFGLRREIDRLFDDTFGGTARVQTGWIPATDIRDTDAAMTLEMELPGISPDLVEVTTDKGVLTIKGRREATDASDAAEKNRWLVTERVHGAFQRSFQLPENVDGNAIEATFNNGLLTLRLPKIPKAEPRRIVITSN